MKNKIIILSIVMGLLAFNVHGYEDPQVAYKLSYQYDNATQECIKKILTDPSSKQAIDDINHKFASSLYNVDDLKKLTKNVVMPYLGGKMFELCQDDLLAIAKDGNQTPVRLLYAKMYDPATKQTDETYKLITPLQLDDLIKTHRAHQYGLKDATASPYIEKDYIVSYNASDIFKHFKGRFAYIIAPVNPDLKLGDKLKSQDISVDVSSECSAYPIVSTGYAHLAPRYKNNNPLDGENNPLVYSTTYPNTAIKRLYNNSYAFIDTEGKMSFPGLILESYQHTNDSSKIYTSVVSYTTAYDALKNARIIRDKLKNGECSKDKDGNRMGLYIVILPHQDTNYKTNTTLKNTYTSHYSYFNAPDDWLDNLNWRAAIALGTVYWDYNLNKTTIAPDLDQPLFDHSTERNLFSKDNAPTFFYGLNLHPID